MSGNPRIGIQLDGLDSQALYVAGCRVGMESR